MTVNRRGGAEERVLRIVSLLFGVGALVFGALDLGAIQAQLDSAPPWWTVAALVAILGTSLVLGATAPFAPRRVLRALAAAAAIGYLAVSVTMPFVFAPVATSDAAPWPLALTALGTTAAALAFRPAVAWSATLLLGALVAVDRITTASTDLVAIAVQDAAYATFFAAVFVALTLGSRAAACRVDVSIAAADRAAAEAAVDRLRQDERSRVDALVHDRVLATLLLAGRAIPGSEIDVRHQAGAALIALQELSEHDATARDLPVEEFTDRLRNQTTLLAPWAQVKVLQVPDAPPLPAIVAEALLGAVSEALRNAVQHAGAEAALAIRAELGARAVEVLLVDDGTGFDPHAVPAGRLGISASIVGRMQAVGGTGEVRSRTGRGTAVRLCWERP